MEVGMHRREEMREVPAHQVYNPSSFITVESSVSKTPGGAPETYEFVVYPDVAEEHGISVGAPIHLGVINMQVGPVRSSVNGITTEVMLAVTLDRLQHFQRGKLKSRETAMAIQKIEEALMWLRARVEKRVQREVYGTDEP